MTRYAITLSDGFTLATGFTSATEVCIWAAETLTPHAIEWQWAAVTP